MGSVLIADPKFLIRKYTMSDYFSHRHWRYAL